jgi:hypothetical protein
LVLQIASLKKTTMGNTVKILTFKNEIESILLDEILTEKNIPHIIHSYHDSALDGLWQAQSGWGHIDSEEEYRQEILEIYENMSKESLLPE